MQCTNAQSLVPVAHKPEEWLDYGVLQAGCKIGPDFFQVESCDALVGGGFRPPDGVRILARNPAVTDMESITQYSSYSLLLARSGRPSIYLTACTLDTHARRAVRMLRSYLIWCSHASSQVVVCHNHVGGQHQVDVALVHELVHAYDHCRGADLDWSNCDHHACSEVGKLIV